MKFLILIVLFASIASERLTVDVYTESLCPDCIEFIEGSMKKAIAVKDLDQMVHLRVIPYGNAKKSQSASGTWSFTCQHGAIECYGNMIELCAQQRVAKLYSGIEAELPQVAVVECIDSHIKRPYSNKGFDNSIAICAPLFNINSDDVITCANGAEGNLLHLIAADETDALKPAHNYVPWIVANRAHDVIAEDAILSSLLKWACDTYQGEKIAACANQIE